MNSEMRELKILCEEATRKLQEIRERMSNIVAPKEPQLIQGYTAEQWSEIIDGGYLCEVWDKSDQSHRPIVKLREFAVNAGCKFRAESGLLFYNCRPAQIKGVMRPIFVEPVGKDALCHFVNKYNMHVYQCKWSERASCNHPYDEQVTKYIEL